MIRRVAISDLNPESWTKNFRGFICQKKKEKNMVMQKC